MNDIYESPKSKLENRAAKGYKLYKISGIGVATFFGTVFAGGLLMSLNFQKLGMEEKAKKCLIYSLVATLAVLLFSLFFQNDMNIPNYVITIPQLVAMVQIAKSQQAQFITEHGKEGGLFASNWVAFGISLFILVCVLLFIFSLIIIFGLA